jgi:hypothetical protein
MGRLDKVLQGISELTEVVKQHNQSGDTATIDYKKLAAEVTKQQDELAAINAPVRRGEEIPAPGQPTEVVKDGKFAGVDPIDVYLTWKIFQGIERKGTVQGQARTWTIPSRRH